MTDWVAHTVWGCRRQDVHRDSWVRPHTPTTRTKAALDVWKSRGLYVMVSIQENTHTHTHIVESDSLLCLVSTLMETGDKVSWFSQVCPWLFIFSFSPLLQSQTARCGSSSSWLARSGPQGGAFRNPGSRAGGEPGPERSKVTARSNRGQTGSQPAPIGADSASQPPRSPSVHTSVFRWLKPGVQPDV